MPTRVHTCIPTSTCTQPLARTHAYRTGRNNMEKWSTNAKQIEKGPQTLDREPWPQLRPLVWREQRLRGPRPPRYMRAHIQIQMHARTRTESDTDANESHVRICTHKNIDRHRYTCIYIHHVIQNTKPFTETDTGTKDDAAGRQLGQQRLTVTQQHTHRRKWAFRTHTMPLVQKH